LTYSYLLSVSIMSVGGASQ